MQKTSKQFSAIEALKLVEQMLKSAISENAGAALSLLRWHWWLKHLLRRIIGRPAWEVLLLLNISLKLAILKLKLSEATYLAFFGAEAFAVLPSKSVQHCC